METYSPTMNAPVHDTVLMEIGKCRRDLGYEESHSRLWERSHPFEVDCGTNFVSNRSQCTQIKRTSQITSKHQIQDEEAVFIVLEGVSQVDHEWVIDLR